MYLQSHIVYRYNLTYTILKLRITGKPASLDIKLSLSHTWLHSILLLCSGASDEDSPYVTHICPFRFQWDQIHVNNLCLLWHKTDTNLRRFQLSVWHAQNYKWISHIDHNSTPHKKTPLTGNKTSSTYACDMEIEY